MKIKMKPFHTERKTCDATRGATLAELLMYTVILSILSLALIYSVNSLFTGLTQLKAREELTQSGILALERISREVRRARSVDLFDSALATNPGLLVLNTTTLSNTPATLRIGLTGGRVTLQENMGAPAPLTHSAVGVSNLTFTRMTNPTSEGVYIELTVTRVVRGTVVSKDFSTFAVLKGS